MLAKDDEGQVARILVLGHQRSGTSAIASLLAAAGAIPLVDDPTWSYTANVERVYGDAGATRAFLEQHRKDFERGILKAPALTALAPLIEKWNPALKFLVVVRNPRDTVAAVLEWRRHRDATSSADFWNMRWLGIDEKDRVQALARRWLSYMQAAEQLTRATWVSYDRFVGDKQATVKRLMQALDLEERAPITTLIDRQFKKDFGDQRIQGKNRWRSELLDEQAEKIDTMCDHTWHRLECRSV